MHDGQAQRDVERAVHEGMAGLVLRLGLALGASAATGIGVERLLSEAVDSFAARGLLSAGAAAALVGLALWQLVVLPLTRSRADLHERYEAALADSLADPLTGLGNHRAFQEELDRQVEAAQRYDVPLSLVILDIDRFKMVNDEKGHAAGDRTLAAFGAVVAGSIRRADRPFRIGGDEFAILLPHTDAQGARILARRLLAEALQPALRIGDGAVRSISFSAGISAVAALASNRAQLYSQADSALYQAKRAGRTEVLVFDPAVAPDGASERSGLAVAEVIARGQLQPVYQPIVDLASGALLGVEGLIRPVPPAPFADPGSLFAAAEASGHLVALDLTCVETIVAGAEGLQPGAFLSVNLSPATFESPDFSAAALLGILARHRFPSERLVIELTERQEIGDPEKARVRLEACRRAGVRLAADDVGAGNAGLRLLSELRFDLIKVDLGLIQRSVASSASSAVVESVVSLAARTGALVVGEGIEQPGQIAQLLSLGVQAGQGFLLGRPGSLPQNLAVRSLSGMAALAPAEVASPMRAWRQSIGLPV